MGIGAISGLSPISYGGFSNYKVNSINGNPKSLNPVEKIGSEQYNSKPFATVSMNEGIDTSSETENTAPKTFDMEAAMNQMKIASRFNAENIPFVGVAEA